MADSCHVCGGISNDDCVNCGQATCRRHGKYVGDHFLCFECIEREKDNE